jgi:hypothetical protein
MIGLFLTRNHDPELAFEAMRTALNNSQGPESFKTYPDAPARGGAEKEERT